MSLQTSVGASASGSIGPDRRVQSRTTTETILGHTSNARLEEMFTRIETGNRRQYTDTEIQQIQTLLGYTNRSWSQVPRTYIVLRLGGHVDLLDNLIELGFTDHWFPVSAPILPDILGPAAKANILNAQNRVLTKLLTLEKGKDGQHACFGPGEDLPFETKAILGRGGSGVVEKVLSLISFKHYALKRIPRQKYFRGAANSMATCITELEVIRRLEHRHIVDFVGSYTDPEFIGLLMSPVADCNLADYFKLIPSSEDHQSLLRSFFGCLATALAYLHESRVRHKDVKPQNILIKAGNVLFADFGLARDSLDVTCSVSDGASGFSPRYCAPEVAAFEPRDSSSDIWSLGCVYLEMVSVLKGWTVTEMQDYLEQHGSRSSYVRCNENGMLQLLATLGDVGEIHDSLPLDWIETMLEIDRSSRPTARTLAGKIESANRSIDARISFCGICCMTEYGFVAPEGDLIMTGMDEGASPSLPYCFTAKKRKTQRKAAGRNRTQMHSSPVQAESTSITRRSKRQQAPATLRSSPPFSRTADVEDGNNTRGGGIAGIVPRGILLIRAVKQGNGDVVSQLLINGASPNTKDNVGGTPLHYAARDGHVEIAGSLWAFGADIKASDHEGRKVLCWAAMQGQCEMVYWILLWVVDPDKKDIKGNSPLSHAAGNGHVGVVRLLLRRSEVEADSIDEDGGTPLSWAAWTGQSAVVKALMGQGVESDRKDTRWGRTPFSWAAGAGHAGVLKLLYMSGNVELDSIDHLWRTPLSYAAEHGHNEVISWLLARPSVDPLRKDRSGNTALDYAKISKRKSAIGLLSQAEDP
ncbi:hypothetical protein MMC30_003628 [Trapelia coarctata]|nr:hypothetical protein [Trapelia coarctata]